MATATVHEAILVATRDLLKGLVVSSLGYSSADAYVGIEPHGAPKASFGEWYISMDEGGVTVNTADRYYLKEIYQIEIHVIRRTGQWPSDVHDKIYMKASTGIAALERFVIKNIHGNHTLRTNAITELSDDGDILQQPLWYSGRSRTRYEDASWNGDEDGDATFMVRTLTFSGMDRIQALDIME